MMHVNRPLASIALASAILSKMIPYRPFNILLRCP
jgi:hypothetical protein